MHQKHVGTQLPEATRLAQVRPLRVPSFAQPRPG